MKRPAPVITILALLLLLNGLSILVQLAAGAPTRQTALHDGRVLLLGRQQADSWRVMGMALDYMRGPHEENVYEALLFQQGIKFQYPMSSLLFVQHLSAAALARISQISIFVMALATWWIFRTALVRARYVVRDELLMAIGVLGVVTTFHPVMTAFTLGQIQAWINAAFACALLAWMAGRDRTAGAIVGVMLLIKPTFAPLLLWGLIRGRRRFWITAAGVAVTGAVAGAFVFGFDDSLAYLRALNYIGIRGEVFHHNQSWNGLLNRLLGNGDSLEFDRTGFPPPHAGVQIGTLVISVALMALALWKPARSRVAGGALDFSIMTLTLTMASPVAWDHHYGVLLPIFAAVGPTIVATRAGGRFTIPLLVTSAFVAAQPLLFLRAFAAPPWNLVQSHLLAAACVLLWLSYRALDGAAAPVSQPGISDSPTVVPVRG